MGLFKPAWMKDNEEAAIKAIRKEKNSNKLHLAARVAPSFRVRSIAFEKLGNQHGAAYQIALHSPDEAECLAVLDSVDWGGWDQTLSALVLGSTKEAVADKALELIQDDAVLIDIIAKARDEQSALKMLDKIERAGALERLCKQKESSSMLPSVRFEAGRRMGDCETCASALSDMCAGDAHAVLSALATIDDEEFLKQVVEQWLATAEKPLEIFAKLRGKQIVAPRVARSLEDFFCPDGQLHDLESTSYFIDADSDERIGRVRCRNCGYLYMVDECVIRYGTNCGYMFRPDERFAWLAQSREIVCRPGCYQCASCGATVQPEDGAPAPCICPTCGAENHDWEHVNDEIVHRDYSSGSSYDICRRCSKKKDIVIHGGW